MDCRALSEYSLQRNAKIEKLVHDPQYQGFFDIPVDNLYGRSILKRYIQTSIPNYQQAVIVSPGVFCCP